MQVESENGSITNDIPTVLQKWKNDFSNLFNPNENEILDNEANILHTIGAAQPMMNDTEMNGMFTCDELAMIITLLTIKTQLCYSSFLLGVC